jgi:hypothetical protein
MLAKHTITQCLLPAFSKGNNIKPKYTPKVSTTTKGSSNGY